MGLLRSSAVTRRLGGGVAVCVSLILGLAVCSLAGSQHLFVGRTTLIVRGDIPGVKASELPSIVIGPDVKVRTEKTLGILGIVADLSSIKAVNAEIVPDTNIIRIDVESSEAEVAKAAADVYAAEFKRLMQERIGETSVALETKESGGTIRVISPVSVKKDGDIYAARAVIAPGKSASSALELSAKELANIVSSQTVVSETVRSASVDSTQMLEILKTMRVKQAPGGQVICIKILASDPDTAVKVVEGIIAATGEVYELITRPSSCPVKVIEPAYVFPK